MENGWLHHEMHVCREEGNLKVELTMEKTQRASKVYDVTEDF